MNTIQHTTHHITFWSILSLWGLISVWFLIPGDNVVMPLRYAKFPNTQQPSLRSPFLLFPDQIPRRAISVSIHLQGKILFVASNYLQPLHIIPTISTYFPPPPSILISTPHHNPPPHTTSTTSILPPNPIRKKFCTAQHQPHHWHFTVHSCMQRSYLTQPISHNLHISPLPSPFISPHLQRAKNTLYHNSPPEPTAQTDYHAVPQR